MHTDADKPTTLVRILAMLMKPEGGRARVAGYDVAADPRAVRRAIGLVGQYALVDETLTGRENLEMTARLYHLSRADARRQAAAVLDRLSLADAAGYYVVTSLLWGAAITLPRAAAALRAYRRL